MMKKVQMGPFQIIGISARTTNENQQAKKDIGELWSRIMTENIKGKIPNLEGDNIYAVYTDYEGDHTQPYTVVIGYEVSTLKDIPEGMFGVEINEGDYQQFTAKGDLTKNAVVEVWGKIWNSNDLQRTYTSDFEVYGEKALDPTDGEADIYIAVK